MIRYRRLFLLPLDTLFVCASYYLAYVVRFERTIPAGMEQVFWTGFIASLCIKPAAFLLAGFYRRLWRYASIPELILVIKTVFLSCLASSLVTLIMIHFQGYSRSVLVMDWLFLNTFIFIRSLLWRIGREYYLNSRKDAGIRTIIIGAGNAAHMLLQEIRHNDSMDYNIVGLLDDDPAKTGAKIFGIPVLGELDAMPEVAKKYKPEQAIIALPSAGSLLIHHILTLCRESGIPVKTLPALSNILEQDPLTQQIRDVNIEDLLGRDPIRLNTEDIKCFLTGKKVMVTGAGGSIGSEICRQVAKYHPAGIILFENAETPLFQIERELHNRYPHLPVDAVIGDIRYRARVEAVFNEFRPEVIFHAAAYKHVPMMEHNPAEAVNNNVRGTMILADTADAAQVQHFVMISTDKAVNPVNVMGASKRAAEMYVQLLARKSRTRFITVRFGNVLGSNGSVIPLFKEQIQQGGPVTVTHPEVIRYFMTIPEATQLVLQAATMGRGGEIFLLDMGKPVKIVDLAEELIRLSGLRPHEDIKITYTGLRPGEKLYEELLLAGEGILNTSHEKIHIARAISQDSKTLVEQFETLFLHVRKMEPEKVLATLREIVPEYQLSVGGRPEKDKVIELAQVKGTVRQGK